MFFTTLFSIVAVLIPFECKKASAFNAGIPASLVPTFLLRNPVTTSTTPLWGSLDYEYIPPKDASSLEFETNLKSSYPPGTPAGLRGEAIRSALKSGRCVAWNFADSTILNQGIVSIRGPGYLEFLNSKLSQSFHESESSRVKPACLLDSRGRLVDILHVALEPENERALLLTSPGHSADDLFARLDPFIFPMDKIEIENHSQQSIVFAIASTQTKDLKKVVEEQICPRLSINPSKSQVELLVNGKGYLALEKGYLYIFPMGTVPECAATAWTICVLANKEAGNSVWDFLISNENRDGPIHVGELEYESLRVEMAMPAFGFEMTAAMKDLPGSPASPFELHLQSLVDTTKGCYLGQEGIASVLKNPRGPPRSFVQVIFENEINIYDQQSCDDVGQDNLTRVPRVGDQLYALGTNEEVFVGTLTSVAEPNGSGKSCTLCLGLTKRADSVLKQLKGTGVSVSERPVISVSEDGSGMILPPPIDPLHGLEVIVGGSFTVGKIVSIPSRRFSPYLNMFQTDQEMIDVEVSNGSENYSSSEQIQNFVDGELNKKAKDEDVGVVDGNEAGQNETDDDAELKRKEAKLEMLRKKAEEAMARRKAKKLKTPGEL